jgi:hypothetical protein
MEELEIAVNCTNKSKEKILSKLIGINVSKTSLIFETLTKLLPKNPPKISKLKIKSTVKPIIGKILNGTIEIKSKIKFVKIR